MKTEVETEEATGAKAVRQYLIDPLIVDGLIRPRGTSEKLHQKQLSKLVQKLKYCAVQTLIDLRAVVLASAEGSKFNEWPSVATVVNTAYEMQTPPDESNDIVLSWFRSGAGESARQLGIELATYHYIKRWRRPPVPRTRENREFAKRRILSELQDHQREIDLDLEIARKRQSMNELGAEGLAHLEAQEALKARLDALIDAGIEHRRAKAEGEAC